MSVTYYIASGQSNFNAATTAGLPVWEAVLPEPNDKVLFRQSFMQTAASYTPLTLNTQYSAQGQYGVPSSPTFYLVAEENFTDVSGGLLQWDRVYARVPQSWEDPEEFVFEFPAYLQSGVAGSYYSITSITTSGSNYAVYSPMPFTVGDQIYIAANYVRDSQTYYIGQYTKTIGGTSASFALVSSIFLGSGAFSSVTGVVTKKAIYRALPLTKIVGSVIVNDYALSSPTLLDSDLPLLTQFIAVDANGQETQFLNTATQPVSATYAQMVADQTLIAAEDSIRRRFYGNIYVRSTRMIPAS